MNCPKTSRCGCPGVKCKIPSECKKLTKSICRKSSRKPTKSRRKSPCGPGKVRDRDTGYCRMKKSPGRPRKASKSRRKPSRKPAKSRRKSPCGPGKVRDRETGYCRMKKSPGRPRKASKSRRKPSRKPAKSQRKSPCRPGKVFVPATGRCRMIKPSKSRRKSISSGWSKMSPNTAQRTTMLKNCGKKCFLGPKKSFPICAKGTCKVNDKGLHAAYVRARQWGGSPKKYKGKTQPTMNQATYQKIARSAKSRLARRGYKVEK